MGRFSCVVLLETLFKISRHSQIALALRRNTLDKIDVIHGWPSFAEASEGILLRTMNHANPAKRVARSRMEELGTHLRLPQWMEPARSQIEQILPPIQVPRKRFVQVKT